MESQPVALSHLAVLCLGNLLNQDEGFGVHAFQALQTHLEGMDVDLVDGGVLGLDLLPIVEGSSHLLIIDAVEAGCDPGTVIELTGDRIPFFQAGKLSEHQITFQEVLGIAHFRARLPRTLYLIGVQPGDLSLGIGLSPAIAAALPEVVARAQVILESWRREAHSRTN